MIRFLISMIVVFVLLKCQMIVFIEPVITDKLTKQLLKYAIKWSVISGLIVPCIISGNSINDPVYIINVLMNFIWITVIYDAAVRKWIDYKHKKDNTILMELNIVNTLEIFISGIISYCVGNLIN